MRRLFCLLTLALLPAVLPAPMAAQVPGVLGVEARVGGAVGSYAPTGAGLQMAPEPAWAVSLSWGPSRAVGAYASYASVGFGCDQGFCRGYDVSFVSRGMSLGVRAEAPVTGAPWARAGVLLHELKQTWRGTSPPGSARADAGAGFEAAVGMSWLVEPGLDVGPSLHLGFLPTRGEGGITERAFFAGLDIGIRLVLDSGRSPL
jgi:hypothetical protein